MSSMIYTAVEFHPIEGGFKIQSWHVVGASWQEACRKFREYISTLHQGKLPEVYISTDLFRDYGDLSVVPLTDCFDKMITIEAKTRWVSLQTNPTRDGDMTVPAAWARC